MATTALIRSASSNVLLRTGRQYLTGNCFADGPHKKGDIFVAEIEMPGVDPQSIDIDVDDRTLTVRAERSTKKSEGVEWVSRERRVGAFARQLNLGRGLATDKITAEYEDGVLKLAIPVAEEAKPRKISVNHVLGSSSQGEVEGSADESEE